VQNVESETGVLWCFRNYVSFLHRFRVIVFV